MQRNVPVEMQRNNAWPSTWPAARSVSPACSASPAPDRSSTTPRNTDPTASPIPPATTCSAASPATSRPAPKGSGPGVFQPLDFLAELTQHIPNQGEHLVRYYGHYSNKTRGLRAKQVAAQADPDAQPGGDEQNPPIITDPVRLDRRRWAMLIKRIGLYPPKAEGRPAALPQVRRNHVEDPPWREDHRLR